MSVCKYSPFRQVQQFIVWYTVNSLPNDKISDWSKFKAFADNKNKCYLKTETCFGKGRKHCGKGYQHFLLFQQCLQ